MKCIGTLPTHINHHLRKSKYEIYSQSTPSCTFFVFSYHNYYFQMIQQKLNHLFYFFKFMYKIV